MSAKTDTAAKAEEAEIPGAPEIYRVVQELWNRSVDGLTKTELKWFAGCSENARTDFSNLADMVENIGGDVAFNDDSCLVGKDATSRLLFTIAASLRGSLALSFVGEFATDRLRHWDMFQQIKNK